MLTSQEWADIQLGSKDGRPVDWEDWRGKTGKTREEQWARMDELGKFHRRRPAMESTEELGDLVK